MSFFEKVQLAPPDPILGLTAAFQRDERKDKVNLGVGLYKTEELTTPVLASVKEAESALWDFEQSKEYLPIDGEKMYLEMIGDLVFGNKRWQKEKKRIAATQTVGGTGALKIGGTFLKEEINLPVTISTPTWPNHRGVLAGCGLTVETYPYYDEKNHALNFDVMSSHLEKLHEGTTVLLHASCHNPTGSDPTIEEWGKLCALFKRKKLIPFFDLAYQGLGKGLDEDAASVRLFLDEGVEMLIAVSNAKNLSLYGERVGGLMIVSSTEEIAQHILSRVKQVIRTNYSNPPMHGARVAARILGTPALRHKWEAELKEMRQHINEMRTLLADELKEKSKNIDFSHIAQGNGMFGFTGLNKIQVHRLTERHGIYLPIDGRINVCGLNHTNINYVVDAIVAIASQER